MSAGRVLETDGVRWRFDAGADSLDFTSGSASEVADWLLGRYERLPAESLGERELVDALALRAAITRLAAGAADGTAPDPDDVDMLNLFAATPDIPPHAGRRSPPGRSRQHPPRAGAGDARAGCGGAAHRGGLSRGHRLEPEPHTALLG